MRGSDFEIFGGKTFSGLLKDIYDKSTTKSLEIREMITTIDKLINSSADAVNLGPIVQQLLDTSVKNDDQLVKMAQIIQRLVTNELKEKAGAANSEILTEEEKEQLLKTMKEKSAQLSNEVDADLGRLKSKIK